MKRIILTRMSLRNFKGIRELDIEFDADVTNIYGANGTGKTTVFDAFTWVLFEKDSQDRKQFEIKTLGADGQAIERLTHEVTVTLEVDSQEITLCRRYNEKWVKTKGETIERFAGHEVERLYNDVPCSASEFRRKIAELCDETLFKFITSPTYFGSQKPDAQRAMLMQMAGGVKDSDVARGNEEFTRLLASITGKTLDEYRREIVSKKRIIKVKIDETPGRFDELDRMMPRAADYNAIRTELTDKRKALANIEAQMSNDATAQQAINDSKLKLQRELSKVRRDRVVIEDRAQDKADERYRKAMSAINEQRNRLQTLLDEIDGLQSRIKVKRSNIEHDRSEIAKCQQKRDELIAEWRAIKAKTVSFDEGDFVCPTCRRRYDVSEIENRQSQILANFKATQSALLKENVEKGQGNNEAKTAYEADIARLEAEIAEHEKQIQTLQTQAAEVQTQIKATPLPQRESSKAMLDNNEEYKTLCAKEQQLLHELAIMSAPKQDDELTDAKNMLTESIAELEQQLATEVTINNIKERKAQLERELVAQNEELAQLEGIEFTIAAFAKARINAIEDKINALFRFVHFKMFDTQINGAEVETCEAVVNGVPYASLNHAMRINAGLDIINAICKSQGVCAPIFIDNAESVNTLERTEAQKVCLTVSTDTKLTITKTN